MAEKSSPDVVASGVEALIDRLRGEGVAAGKAEADKIVAEAQRRARQTVQTAKDEAEQIVAKAQETAQELQRAGMDALRAAARDAVLELKNRLIERFGADVQRLVTAELKKEEVLQRMILEVAGRARETAETAERVEVLLPRTAIDLEQVRRNPEQHAGSPLAQFVRDRADDMLRAGVSLSNDPALRAGLRVRVGAEGVELDLSDAAIAGLLMVHLQPRFRAMLDGVVR